MQGVSKKGDVDSSVILGGHTASNQKVKEIFNI